MKYTVIIEKAPDNYAAYVPDLPGCVACGDSVEEARGLIAEAIHLHIESLRGHGESVPPPTSVAVTVPAA